MKKPFFIGIALLLVVLGYSSFLEKSDEPSESAPTAPSVVSVTTETADSRKQSKETLSFAGIISSEGTAEIVARSDGTVTVSHPAIGSHVNEGAILAVIDDRSGSDETYLGFRSQDVREAGLSVDRAKKTYQEAKRADERDETHDSELAKDLAKKDLMLAEMKLRSAIDSRTVRSSITGIVTKKDVSVGESVSSGSPLFTIEKSGSKRIVRFFVDENERKLLNPGMPVRIAKGPGATDPSDGKILRISSATDTDSRRFPVEAEISDIFASGTVVSVSIDIVRTAGTGNMLLPLSAIAFGQDHEKIFIAENGHAKSISVSVIRIEGELAEVSAPIGEDAEIIIGNAKRVKDGAMISATNR